ncbi:type VII secretion protein EccCa [Mycobacterium sp. B14F4]|uniref:type VII secretion protein EccCa n=1 Tax=Mycobacterium sp. B14F4 TaxID=3153565 RepID=UPI00325F60D8
MEFDREQRLPVPPVTTGEVAVKAPPALPKPAAGNAVARLLPLVMLVACVGMMAVYFTTGVASKRSPMFMFFPVMMAMSALGSVVYGARGGAARSAEIDASRRNYLRYLDSLDDALAAAVDAQRRSQRWSHPGPELLWALVGDRRMWERRPGDSDCLRVRIGVGSLGLCTPLAAPDANPDEDADPVTTSAMRTLVGRRSAVDGLPVALPLREIPLLTIHGDRETARAMVRAMVCQLAVWHGPDQVAIAAVVDSAYREPWDWLKWLPQHQDSHQVDAVGPVRLVFDTVEAAVTALGTGSRHPVVILDGGRPGDAGAGAASERITVIEVAPTLCENTNPVSVTLDADGMTVRDSAGYMSGRPDALTQVQATVCARRLSRYVLGAATSDRRRSPTARDWLDLMDMADPHALATERLWGVRSPRIKPVPIGVAEDGSPVTIDINEAAHGGIGPHGLCVGATGSGKSEFLRTLVLGLITCHPPDVLNLVLVDFKGGATFLGLERARHVAAVITNLADEAHLVARMSDALAGELHRRQEVLRAAGGFANTDDYHRARARGEALGPLPALVVIVDEFSELLSQNPDFAELFVAIGRVGRSLGIHLLLASQRLDEGRLRGLDTHLSYRICLKTFSPSESRSVLGVPDAHQLPNTPGAALLKTAAGDLIRFQTAFVSEPCRPPQDDAAEPAAPRVFTAAAVREQDHRRQERDVGALTVLEAVVDRVAGRGDAAHRIWLPPLDASPTLDMLETGGPALSVPIGLVDSPFEQRRGVLSAQLGGAGGNVAIVGAPRSGKSTTLRTLMLALAETHGPAEVSFYCLDFGGGTLAGMRPMPHVGSVAGRHDADLCRRTVAVMASLMRSREEHFRRSGIDSMTEYRAQRATTDCAAADPYGDVFLVVDGWAAVRQEFEPLEGPISAIAAQGLSFGVHVVLTASRWAELRPAVKDQIATRIELRLGDPAESEMDRRRARTLGSSPPGRGITADGREMVIALPRWDGESSATGLTEAIGATVERLLERWPDARAPQVELLPSVVHHRDLLREEGSERSPTDVVLGLGEHDLRPVVADFAEQPHLLVLGESGCGKSALLRLLCREVIRTASADQVQLEIVDFRRALLGVVESEHLSGYAASPAALTSRLEKVLDRLRARLPGEDVTQRQLRDRSWWSGPAIFLVIDDYDLVAASTGNPLTPLADFLPHAADLGLHVVVARRSGGAARAMFDPVLARMREVGCMGLMMSASPEEGVLLGSVRPSPQPPGRGTLTTRSRGEQLVQIGWTEPP